MFAKYEEGQDGQQRQKRAQTMCQMRRLGLMYVFFFLHVFFVTKSCIIGSTYKLMMEKGGNEGNGPK